MKPTWLLLWAVLFQVVAHASDCGIMRDFVDRLLVLFKRCPPACRWLLAEASSQPSLALSPLLTATDRRVRCSVARLLCEVRVRDGCFPPVVALRAAAVCALRLCALVVPSWLARAAALSD